MKSILLALLTALAVFAAPAPDQAAPKKAKDPHVGYVYPAGGERGATFRMYVGGQYLRGVNQVLVSGEGVRGQVLHHYRPLGNLDAPQRREIIKRLRETWEARVKELPEAERKEVSRAAALQLFPGKPAKGQEEQAVEIPDHPLLNNIPEMNLWQLAHTARELREYRKRQRNAQLGELVEVELVIDADAAPGLREFRIGRPTSLSNPLFFQVGTLPETREQEPNTPGGKITLPEQPALTLPAALNGQIMPGDVDRFRFQGKQGQQLVAAVSARRLIPYLADAVPGWFQAVVAVYDHAGKELAYADDYRFHPDPVLFYRLPEDGIYTLEIRDAIYRGREDFVYRVDLGELPYITRVFPLGGQCGQETIADIDGYNLPVAELALETGTADPGMYQTHLVTEHYISNDILYAADTPPEVFETETEGNSAALLALPCTMNGVLAAPGEVDMFTFEGRAGEEVMAEVVARRLGSPLDGLVRLTDSAGTVLAWNDDAKDKLFEILTHHADAVLTATIPGDGHYQVHLLDAQQKGGADYTYRLYLGPPRPDFALITVPSTLNLRTGETATLTIHAVRKGGFQGDIEVALDGAPPGFVLKNAVIPAGQDTVEAALTAPKRPRPQPLVLALTGSAHIGNATVMHRAIPAEDMMQAFLPRHLVPMQESYVSVSGPGRARPRTGKGQPAKKNPKKSPPLGAAP